MKSLAAMLRFPLSWVAILVVVAVEILFFRWFQPSSEAAIGFLVLGAVMLALWPMLLARSPAYLHRLYLTPSRAMEMAAKRRLSLEADLREANCEQGIEQLRTLGEKLEAFTRVLERRLSQGEVTYGRYLSTARQLYLASLDNLDEIVVSLASVSAVDRKSIDDRLEEMTGQDSSEAYLRSRSTLEDRRELHDRQTQRVAALFAENEAAMTSLTRTAAALAEAKLGGREADLTVNEAMSELETLAARAKYYE